jgi:NADH-quinone oxidoreductase subunit L
MTPWNLAGKVARLFKPVYALFYNKWFFDELYHAVIVRPVLWFGRIFWRGDKAVIDGFGPDGVANLSGGAGARFSKFQSGYMFHYAFIMMIGLIVLVSWFFWRSGAGF